MREINGYETATGKPVSGFDELEDDGSTACGCWIYSGVFAGNVNQAPRAATRDGGPVSPEWAWAWPANRRILYSRASADPDGKPVVGAQEARLVGRRAVDGLRRPGLPGRQAAGLHAAARRARAWTRSAAPTRSS